jgi:hypothetical protein
MHTADSGLEVRVPVKAGPHVVGVSFVRRLWESEGILQPPQTGFGRTTNELYFGYPALKTDSIGGPFNATGPGQSPTRRALFVCTPKDAASEEPCALQILSKIATRAYRRPLTDADRQILLDFYRAGRADEGTFDVGIQRGLERILAAPSFIFRVTKGSASAAPVPPGAATARQAYKLSDLDLASRLSFFIWSSIPDEQLLELAARGKLSDPAVMGQQVRRMLADPRSNALITGFATRWLELGKVAGFVPDTHLYPEFDENLREAMV